MCVHVHMRGGLDEQQQLGYAGSTCCVVEVLWLLDFFVDGWHRVDNFFPMLTLKLCILLFSKFHLQIHSDSIALFVRALHVSVRVGSGI